MSNAAIKQETGTVRYFRKGKIDEWGKVIGLWELPADKLPHEHMKYEYDDRGRVIKFEEYTVDYPDRVYYGFYRYSDDSPRPTKCELFDRFGKLSAVYKYYCNDKNLLVKTEEMDQDRNIKYYIQNRYDDKNRLIEKTRYSPDNKQLKKEKILYDNPDIPGVTPSLKAYYNDKNENEGNYYYKWDNRNNLVEKKWYNKDNKLQSYYKYKYDDKDQLIMLTLYSADYTPMSAYEYEYDERGNKISQKTFDGDGELVEHQTWPGGRGVPSPAIEEEKKEEISEPDQEDTYKPVSNSFVESVYKSATPSFLQTSAKKPASPTLQEAYKKSPYETKKFKDVKLPDRSSSLNVTTPYKTSDLNAGASYKTTELGATNPFKSVTSSLSGTSSYKTVPPPLRPQGKEVDPALQARNKLRKELKLENFYYGSKDFSFEQSKKELKPPAKAQETTKQVPSGQAKPEQITPKSSVEDEVKKEKLKIARSLLDKKFPPEEIAEITGLPIEEIKKLTVKSEVEKEKLKIARSLLAKNFPLEDASEITGIPVEELKKLM